MTGAGQVMKLFGRSKMLSSLSVILSSAKDLIRVERLLVERDKVLRAAQDDKRAKKLLSK